MADVWKLRPPVLSVEDLDFSAFEPFLRGLIRTRWEYRNIETRGFLAEQVLALLDGQLAQGHRHPLEMNLPKCALLFGVSKSSLTTEIRNFGRFCQGMKPNLPHRKANLPDEAADLIRKWIHHQEVIEKNPPEPSELLEFIKEKWKIEYSSSWINSAAKKKFGFFVVPAKPLEKPRIEVSEQVLREKAIEITRKLSGIDPRLVCNIDETGFSGRDPGKPKKVLSMQNQPTRFKQALAEGHVTLVAISWANGDFSRPLAIVNTKTIEAKLERYGLPDSPSFLVVASSKGYITGELFELMVSSILVPEFEQRRQRFNLVGQPGLLLMDGASQHSDSGAHKNLEAADVSVTYFVPHSSHICQPLDCAFFGLVKNYFRAQWTDKDDLSKSSNRLLRIWHCHDKAVGIQNGLNSWNRAGFRVCLASQKPTIFYDIDIPLKRDDAPISDVRGIVADKKRKRAKLFFSPAKKRRQEKTQKVAQAPKILPLQ